MNHNLLLLFAAVAIAGKPQDPRVQAFVPTWCIERWP